MIYSLFLSPVHSTFSENVDDPSQSKDFRRFFDDSQFNILYHKFEQFDLDNTETRTISFANYTALSDWPVIIIKCVGSGRLNTTGFDTNGSTGITGKLPVYGTEILPGIMILSSYNVSTFTIESLADDTSFQLYAAIAAEDDDVRLTQNA